MTQRVGLITAAASELFLIIFFSLGYFFPHLPRVINLTDFVGYVLAVFFGFTAAGSLFNVFSSGARPFRGGVALGVLSEIFAAYFFWSAYKGQSGGLMVASFVGAVVFSALALILLVLSRPAPEEQWQDQLKNNQKVNLVGGAAWWRFQGISLFFAVIIIAGLCLLARKLFPQIVSQDNDYIYLWGPIIFFLFLSAFRFWGFWLFSSVRFTDGSLDLWDWKGNLVRVDFDYFTAVALRQKDNCDDFDALLFYFSPTGQEKDWRWEQRSSRYWRPGIIAAVRDEMLRRNNLTGPSTIVKESQWETSTYLVWRKAGDDSELPDIKLERVGETGK
jgi:hypothetical protein